MAVFDLKKAVVKLIDGRKGTLTTTAGAGVNARLLLTDKSTHRGTGPFVSITIVDPPGNNAMLSVTVSGLDITVNAATDGSSAITSTASLIKAAIEALPAAAALVTVTLPGTGAGVVDAQVKTYLGTNGRTLTVAVNDGTLSYTEKKSRIYTKDKGALDTVKDGDEEPIDLKLDVVWDYIKASSGGTETVEDVLKNRGEASDWLTTDADPCTPYCVDVEVKFTPACGAIENEFILFPCFRYESLERDFKSAAFSVSGKCNATEATVQRSTQ